MKDSQYYGLQSWMAAITSLIADFMGYELLRLIALVAAILLLIAEFFARKEEMARGENNETDNNI